MSFLKKVIKDKSYLLLFFSGFTPFVFLWQHDYTLYRTSSAFLMLGAFSLIPVLVYFVLHKAFPEKFRIKLVSFITVFSFLYFSKYVIIKIIDSVFFVENYMLLSILFSFALSMIIGPIHKLVLIFLMVSGGVNSLNLVVAAYNNYSLDVYKQIEKVKINEKFKKKNNVYFVLLDGYTNFNQFDRLGIDNSKFKSFLETHEFHLRPDFISNYFMTPDSLSSILSMGHHYYKSKRGSYETYGARELISQRNNVFRVFKKNNYEVTLMHTSPRLVGNSCADNNCILDVTAISGLRDRLLQLGLPWGSPDYRLDLIIRDYLLHVNSKSKEKGYFDYIHFFDPSHTPVPWFDECDTEYATKWYDEKVKAVNFWVQPLIENIIKADPSGIVVITADHGAFVHNKCSSEVTKDRVSLDAKHGAIMAIRTPDGGFEEYSENMSTSVNIFPAIFDYLAQKKNSINLKPENTVYDYDYKRDVGAYKVFEDGHIVKEKID